MKSYTFTPKEITLNDTYDIIVVGGGPAGSAAAIASARRGAKTLLIEATGALGGMATSGLVPSWCPFWDKEKIIYKGIAEEIFLESRAQLDNYNENMYDWVPIDPEGLKLIYDSKVTESGADVLFNTCLTYVDQNQGEVQAIIVSNKAGLAAYKAKVYIDCTGDADLCYFAGATVLPKDDESGYQPATLCFSLANVDENAYKNEEYLHPNNPNSPIYKIVESGNYDIPDTHVCLSPIYNGTYGFNAGHIWDVENGDPACVSNALIRGRKLAHEIHRALKDYQPKAFGASKIANTAAVIGIRESRRILGDYVLTIDDYMDRKTFPDEICRNCYYIDIHNSKAEIDDFFEGKLEAPERTRRYSKGESHGIPYRCLTPKGLKNVLVAGRSISTDRTVQASTRVMPVCLCMGEAAGKAAVIAKESEQIDVHSIDVRKLRQWIIEDNGYIK